MAETNVAQDQIKAYVDRILRMKEEAKAINADIREIYAEAKGNGFDKTVLGKLVGYVEKRQTDAATLAEHDALFDIYLKAFDGASGKVGTKRASAHTHAHEADWQSPRSAPLGDQKDAFCAGKPISQDFQYENASVYFFAFHDIGRVKIGVTNDVDSRLRELSAEQGCVGEIIRVIPGNRQAEMAEHEAFAEWRTEGEWFRDCPEVRALLKARHGIEMSPSQPTKAAGRDLAASPALSGQVADIQPETVEQSAAANSGSNEDASPSSDESEASGDRTQITGPASIPCADKSVEAPASAAPAPTDPLPGEVYWENTPRWPVKRHEYSAAFGTLGQDIHVITEDIAKAQSAAIVMMGDTILDGWARYNCARGMVGMNGQTTEYPAYQYDGTDPLIDCIRWNLQGRTLDVNQRQIIAKRLIEKEPKRKADIVKAFGFAMEHAA